MEKMRITLKVLLKISRAEATQDPSVYVGKKAYKKTDSKKYGRVV